MKPVVEDIDQTNNIDDERQYQMGVRSLCERGITKVPTKYILPEAERPNSASKYNNYNNNNNTSKDVQYNLKLPVIDFAKLQGPNRSQYVTSSLAKACQEYGFFQLINHGIEGDVIKRMGDVSKRFFDLPFEERSKYMSKDMYSPVRYGTSFNQNNDKVFCWRDFLKLNCHPLSEVLPHWPSSPVDLREVAVNFSNNTKFLYLILMEAIKESLGLMDIEETKNNNENNNGEELDGSSIKFENGSQLIVVNCYPSCPEPELTLGMPPHSDYGFLTLLLQDQVKGLQIQHGGTWVTVEPLPNSFVVNVGDHLEIFSNGRYKSVLHRVVVNSSKPRISIASLHSLPFNCMVRPSPKLIDKANPKRYKDTDFSSFLEHIASREHKNKSFLETRKLITS
ncbi:Thebaine 6-O-demethylase [Morus notabilis]|uniref:Thebaine 6-O-demethylase n=1 Tax=Morus notabilis TaxID=981085 RepID=W9QKU8_9ROSA|nr:protein DMR6-LIKE OXYGENASE 2 [Morus notabilis]EXB39440.1 Thebaine 6-O-demethylase [Morus notabilis]